MFPKSMISRIILWLWKKYHCIHGIHVMNDDGYSCAACSQVLFEELQFGEDEIPEWACIDFENQDHDHEECFACNHNYEYWQANQ